jgi:hypothetical protein
LHNLYENPLKIRKILPTISSTMATASQRREPTQTVALRRSCGVLPLSGARFDQHNPDHQRHQPGNFHRGERFIKQHNAKQVINKIPIPSHSGVGHAERQSLTANDNKIYDSAIITSIRIKPACPLVTLAHFIDNVPVISATMASANNIQ